MHRRLIPVLVLVALASAPFVVGAASASAASATAFCDKVGNFQSSSSSSGADTSLSDAKAFAKTLRAAAKTGVPNKVKKALKTMAGYYDQIGSSKTAAAKALVLSRLAAKYGKAFTVFYQYYIQSCIPALTTTTTR